MHWYRSNGEPCHYQENGKATTLRDARRENLKPSVTSVLSIVSNPGLTAYFINQHLEAAWETGKNHLVTNSERIEWCKEVRQRAGEHSKQARDKGTEIHHALDVSYSDSTEEVLGEVVKYVRAVEGAIEGVYGVLEWESEKTFATEQWGGSVDLSNPNIVVDYKFKSGGWELKKDGTPKKIWYDSHISQLAAYRFGLGYPDAKCANVFISPDAKVFIKEYTEEELRHGLEYFLACNQLWRLKNKL